MPTAHQPDGGYYRPSDFETATSWVHGLLPAPTPAPGPRAASPRAALDRVLVPCLTNQPCYVAFSGGRDSSGVLAAATVLARREGLPDPVPVTEVYPDVPESDESSWQETVIRHLGLRDWMRLEIREENDLLGEVARDSLSRRGLLWPPPLHIKTTLLGQLQGGTLVTGEGGDEVLGDRRVAALARAVRVPASVSSLGRARAAAIVLAPAMLRRQRIRRRLNGRDLQPWLRPHIREQHYGLLAQDLASEPLRASGSLRWLLRRRASVLTAGNYEQLAREHGMTLAQPLLDPPFVTAMADAVGGWGLRSRTEAMDLLFGHDLPAAVVARTSKAYFNRAYIGDATRQFARTWDGTGVDPELVDAQRLRQEWLSEFPSSISTLLLHSAWLGSAQPARTPGVAA